MSLREKTISGAKWSAIATVIIIGNEGFGITDKVLKSADFVAKIPMPGRVTSLNAAVATAVFLAACIEQRRKKGLIQA